MAAVRSTISYKPAAFDCRYPDLGVCVCLVVCMSLSFAPLEDRRLFPVAHAAQRVTFVMSKQ